MMTDRPSNGGAKDPIAILASRVGWLRVIVSIAVTLLLAGAGVTVYASSFETRTDANSRMDQHAASDGHPSLTRRYQDICDRLIRVETIQVRGEENQRRMEDKLDRLLQRVPVWQPGMGVLNP